MTSQIIVPTAPHCFSNLFRFNHLELIMRGTSFNLNRILHFSLQLVLLLAIFFSSFIFEKLFAQESQSKITSSQSGDRKGVLAAKSPSGVAYIEIGSVIRLTAKVLESQAGQSGIPRCSATTSFPH